MAEMVKVIKVREDAGGPTLILREDEKQFLFDYFEDWCGIVTIEFCEMPRDEADNLPEFDGF